MWRHSLLLVVIVALTFAQFAVAQEASPPPVEEGNRQDVADEKWVSLFNGKNLDGWTPKICFSKVGENYNNTFRVEDGVLKVSYDKYDKFGARFGHLFYEKPFSHYRLRLEYRIVGKQVAGGAGWAIKNSGLMLHGQTPESMAIDQEFPVSLEVQFLGGNGRAPRSTANLCTPGTNVVMGGKLITQHCNNSNSPTFHDDRWVKVEVEVRGSERIRHYVNGQLVLEYESPQYDPQDDTAKPLIEKAGGELRISSGTISLQSESHPVEFRKIEILELAEDAP